MLRPIIPTVVYHGREQWRVTTEFGGLFSGPESLRPYWPQFRYELQDLSALSDEEVRGTVHLQIGLLVLKYIFDPALQGRLTDILLLFVTTNRKRRKGRKDKRKTLRSLRSLRLNPREA